jgi:hypothetical protein
LVKQLSWLDVDGARHRSFLHAQANLEMECAALAGLAFHPDAALHESGEALADGQAQAGAAGFARHGAVGLGERFEDTVLFFGGHAEAGVAHGKVQAGGVGGFGLFGDADDDFAATSEITIAKATEITTIRSE